MSPPPPSAASNRLVGLDILRIVAVFLVLGRHFPEPYPTTDHWIGWFFHQWRECGWAGVDQFFVLSGFLVGGLLIQERQKYGGIRLARFLIRRGFKIYPAFYVMVAVTLLFQRQFDLSRLLSELLFVQNYFPGLWTHTWSLAVEEHFYLLLSVALTGLAIRQFVPWALAVCAVLPIWRLVHSWQHPVYLPMTHLFPTHLRLDSLLWGVLLAVWYYQERTHFVQFWTRFRVPALLAGSGAFVALCGLPAGEPTVLSAHFVHTIGLTLLAWASAALVSVSITRPWRDTRLLRLIQRVGQNSYSIYLWHMLIFQALFVTHVPTKIVAALHLPATILQSTWAREWNCVIFILASILWGIATAKLIEFPVLHLRDRLFPSRLNRPAEAQQTPSVPPPPNYVAVSNSSFGSG